MNFHEVHIEDDAARLERLSGALPALRLNLKCDPSRIPAGTVCYEYPRGRERELEAAAGALNLGFEWGVVGFRVFGFCQIATKLFLVNQPNDKLFIVNVSNPAVMTILASYDLSGDFAINQHRLQGVCGAGNFIYVQGLGENGVSNGNFIAYNVSNPLIVTQRDSIDYGQPDGDGSKANWLAGPTAGGVVFSIWDGDNSAVACKLRSINVADPDNIAVLQTLNVGTFADRPRRLQLVGTLLYILSGTTGPPDAANQKIFVYDVSAPGAMTLSSTIAINSADAADGVQNFSVDSAAGKIAIVGYNNDTFTTNLLIYTTAGAFVSSTQIYDTISTTMGVAICTKPV